MFAIAYRRNKNEPDCVENKILDSKLRERTGSALQALWQAYSDFPTSTISFYNTATRIILETIGRSKAVTEDLDAMISCLPIPSSLSHIPTV